MPEANPNLSPADPAAPPPVPPKKGAARDTAEAEESSLVEFAPVEPAPSTVPTSMRGFEDEDPSEGVEEITESAAGRPGAPAAPEPEDELAGVIAEDEIPPVAPEPPTVEGLMQEIERLKAGLNGQAAPATAGQPPPAGQHPAAPAAPAPSAPAEPETFVSEDQYEEILGSHDKFNGFLRDFKHKTQVEAVQAAHAIVMPQVAQVAAAIAANIVSTHSTVEKFYAVNPDLANNREYVGKVYQTLLSKFPDWPVEKLVSATAKVAKRGITRAQQTQPPQPAGLRSAAPNVVPMAPPTGARPAVAPRQQLDSLAAELAAVRL